MLNKKRGYGLPSFGLDFISATQSDSLIMQTRKRTRKKLHDYKLADTQHHDIERGEHQCNDRPIIDWSLINRTTLKLKK